MARQHPTGRPTERPPAPTGAQVAARSMRRMLAGVARRALALGRWALAAAGSDTGRRLGRAAALTVALAVLVVTLYERGEVPTAAAQPAAAGAAQGGAAARDPADRARRRELAEHGGLRGRSRPPRVGERGRPPAQVAAAWYAARHRLPAARVRPLQLDRLSARAVRVLVLAEHGRGRLRTALVRVELGPTGWRAR